MIGRRREKPPQRLFRPRQIALKDGLGGALEAGILHRRAVMPRIGPIGAVDVALDEQLFAQQAPGVRELGVERGGLTQGGDGAAPLAQGRQGGAELVLGVGGPGVGAGQGLQQAAGGLRIALPAAGRPEDELDARIVRRQPCQIPGLAFRQRRVCRQEGGRRLDFPGQIGWRSHRTTRL